MENTAQMLFGKDNSRWYVATGQSWVGPFSSAQIYEKIQRQELTWGHFLWKPGQKDWQRAYRVEPFRSFLPEKPKVKVPQANRSQKTQKSSTRSSGSKDPFKQQKQWYLFFRGKQYGPFSSREVEHLLAKRKIPKDVFTWRRGLKQWKRLSQLSEFRGQGHRTSELKPREMAEGEEEAEPVQDPPTKDRAVRDRPVHERRSAPRKPLVAKIVMANDDAVLVGVCRDISTGGMQVLTDQIPGEVGDTIRLNVSPSGKDAIEPFVAKGEIVRILEDGRGFSFRFKNLRKQSKEAIERFIENQKTAS